MHHHKYAQKHIHLLERRNYIKSTIGDEKIPKERERERMRGSGKEGAVQCKSSQPRKMLVWRNTLYLLIFLYYLSENFIIIMIMFEIIVMWVYLWSKMILLNIIISFCIENNKEVNDVNKLSIKMLIICNKNYATIVFSKMLKY